MHPKILSLGDIETLLTNLASEQRVMAPVMKDGLTEFDWITDGQALHLPPGGVPRGSMKEALLPRSEVLFYYRTGEDSEATAPPPPPEPQVLFGLHPCDVRGIKVLDAVFGSEPHPDSLYLARRAVTTVVGIGVVPEQKPTFAFFDKLGISPLDPIDTDLFLSPLDDDRFVLEVQTEKGEKLAKHLPDVPDAEEADLESLRTLREAAAAQVTDELSSEDLRSFIESLFDTEFWDEMGERCVGCGSCAYLCPTCHCFDIQDEKHGDLGCRVRNWDTCQFEIFTKHASGHNPRTAQNQRIRQRILHKFDYGNKNFKMPFCVGCGRCILVCPVNNDLLKVLKTIQSKQAEKQK